MSVTIGRRGHSWCVYVHGQFVSDHATRDGAAAAANNHLRTAHPPTTEEAREDDDG